MCFYDILYNQLLSVLYVNVLKWVDLCCFYLTKCSQIITFATQMV